MTKKTAYVFGPAIYATDSPGHIDLVMAISDYDVMNEIISGKIRGLSPEIKVGRFLCSICAKDYEDCTHEIQTTYSGETCRVIASDIEFTGCALASNPKDPRCTVIDMLVVEEKNHERTYTWHGFPYYSEKERFEHIQKALDKKLIPENVAFHFSKFFSINSIGTVKYPY